MSYNALVDAQLVKAFKLLKDLAVDVTLNKKAGVVYSFNLQTTTIVSNTDITTQAILSKSKKSGGTNVTERQAILQRKIIGDITSYDTLTVAGEVWKIGLPVKDNGFITITNIYKEL